LCNPSTAYVGPLLAADGAAADAPFVARFGVTPRVVLIEVDDPVRGLT
jgi:hypothetical protein